MFNKNSYKTIKEGLYYLYNNLGLLQRHIEQNKTKAKILLYHSISPKSNKFTKGLKVTVDPNVFKGQLEYLMSKYKIVSLDELVVSLNERKNISNKIAITFDDGFLDNYNYAYPIIKEYKIPATIFLPGISMNNNDYLWVHKFQYLINTIDQKDLIGYVLKEKLVKNVEFKVDSISTLRMYLMFNCETNYQNEIINKLTRYFNLKNVIESFNLYLNEYHIKEMFKQNISFGCHGFSHNAMSILPDEEIKSELQNNINIIEDIIGVKPNFFAFPFGEEQHFSLESERVINKMGFKKLFLADGKFIFKNNITLSRIKVENESLDCFASRIENFSIRSIFH